MKSNILYTLFASLFCLFQQVSAQCDLSFSPYNTGSNMTILLTPPSLTGPLNSGDSIGVFFVDNQGEEVCGGSEEWTGGMIQIAAMGDDTTTPEKDGFSAGEALLWKAMSASGDVYDVVSTPSATFTANAISNISALVYTAVDCGPAEPDYCEDPLACNYQIDDGTGSNACVYAELYYDCNANCLADADLDGVCDELEVSGCTDNIALNYNSLATDDNGSCEYASTTCDLPALFTGNTGANMTLMLLPGFMNSLNVVSENAYVVALSESGTVYGSALVYGVAQNSIAIWGDDSITPEVDGAAEGESVYLQLVDGTTLYDIYDESDLLLTVSYTTGGVQALANVVNPVVNCSLSIVTGCTDSAATNYNALATEDDGSCEYDVTTCNLPTPYTGNTGSNMTVMLLPGMISSLELTDEDAFIIALTESGMIIGSTPVYGVDQNQIALWGDDTTTPETDGATAGESAYFQLVDGANVFDIYDGDDLMLVSFASGGIFAQSAAVTSTLNCVGLVSEVQGCMDENACNYVSNANTDDESCTYAEENYDCNGVCIADTDSDGICDVYEVAGCTDELATNYNSLATDDDGSCDYPPVVEGCTDPDANNYIAEANTEDGSCLYGVGGCTYEDAGNYNAEANYDDGSCVFDGPYIYVTNPIDGGIYSDSEINITYEAQNITIGYPSVAPEGGHIKYSIDGGAFASEFDQSDVITQEFADGEHTIQFILYNNVSGNIGPWSPAVETTITFTVGPSGCMDANAGNYNPAAILDDGSCLLNADLDFDFTNTGVNHTIMLLDDIGVINVDGIEVQIGDLIGVFYLSNGVYYCAGTVEWAGDIQQLAAMGDDTTTPEQDGFLSGQEFVWAVQFAETGNSVFLDAEYSAQGMNTFQANSISSVVSFNVMEFEGVLGCMDSDYVEYNPFATVDNGTCVTLKIYGCIDNSYLEYWDYNAATLSISEPATLVNTDDGSCQTLVIDGCTDTNYLDYCEVCNVTDQTACELIIVEGCMDSIAENYDTLVNVDNGTCEYDICIQFEVNNFVVDYSTSSNEIVLSYDVVNVSDKVVFAPDFDINLNSSTYFVLGDSMYTTTQMYPEDIATIQVVITNDLTTLPPFVLLSGQVNLTATAEDINGEVETVDCVFDFNEEFVNTQHIGCTSSTAYNYEQEATIDDGSCIDNLNASIVSYNPLCSDEYGSAIVYVTGGFPPYYSPTTYTSYSDLGVPSIDILVEFNEEGVAYLSGLDEGDYVIEVHDDSEIVSFYNFTITMPSDIEVEAEVQSDGLLTSTILLGEPVLYQWLLNGISIEGATNEIHYPQAIGMYQVYVENSMGCGDYSEPVALSFVGIEEFTDQSFTMYPNPAHASITLSLNKLKGKTTVSFTDVLGQELHHIILDSRLSEVDYTFDISEFPDGLYFMNVSNNSNQAVKRFVKN